MDRTNTPGGASRKAAAKTAAEMHAALKTEGWGAYRAEMARLDPLAPMPIQSPYHFARAEVCAG